MAPKSLKECHDHGVNFFIYLNSINCIDPVPEKQELRSIYNRSHFKRLSFNFSKILYSLKIMGKVEVKDGHLITISEWLQKIIDRTETNRLEIIRIYSSEYQFKDGKMTLSVDINTEHTVPLYMENTGSNTVHLTEYKPVGQSSNISLEDERQVTLENPLVLHPGLKHEVCKVKFSGCEVGMLSVKLSFTFREGFHIERIIEAHCVTALGKELAPTAPYRPYPAPSLRETHLLCIIVDGQPPPGIYKKKNFKMQTHISSLISALNDPGSNDKRKMLLEDTLSMENYALKFHLLLDLERHQMELDLEKSNIPNDDQQEVTMERDRFNKDFLTLKVPGLMENRLPLLRGDHVLVNPVQKREKYVAYVESVQQDTLTLGYNTKLLDRFQTGMKFNIEFQLNTLNSGIQHRAIKLTVENKLWPVLFPQAPSSTTPQLPDLRLFDKKLEQNLEQYRAVQHIVAGSSKPAPYLVFGPPGTGKTVTVAEAIKQIWTSQPESYILACAPNNSAADQLCENILKHVDKSSVLRIYAKWIKPSDVSNELKACSNLDRGVFIFPKDYKEKLMKYKVIVTTLLTSSRIVTAEVPIGHFTHVFVDEAGHATEPECLLPLAGLLNPERGQLVLAGDPKQLGPIIKSPWALKFHLGVSLLDRLMSDQQNTLYQKYMGKFDERFVTKLLRNYRSHPAIFKIPNELFYDGELEPFADEYLRNSFSNWEHLPKQGFPIIFHEVTGLSDRESRSPSFFNIAEVEVLMDYVKKLLQTQGKKGHTKLYPRDIGIIAPYWKQVKKINVALRKVEKDSKLEDLSSIKVGSVEEFQGRERIVILLSTVRSSPEHENNDKFKLGFLKNEKRFNVAITRAKALLIIVGNPSVLKSDPTWARFIDYCKDEGGFTDSSKTKLE